MTWQAIWSEGRERRAPPADCDAPLRSVTLRLELSGPLPLPRGRGQLGPGKAMPLRLWHGASADDPVAIYMMHDGAVRLIHGEIDLATRPGLIRPGETIGIRYVTCAEGRADAFEVTNYDQDRTDHLRSGLGRISRLSEVLPRSGGFLTVAHVVAIASSAVPASDLPGVESGALIDTPQGPRPVDMLRPGDLILDRNKEAHPIRWIEGRSRLCLGRMAPIRLRSPYFGLARNLVVTPQTRLFQTGPMVEYLCGTEAVLVNARDLTNGSAVFRDRSRPVRMFFHMMLDDATQVVVERCAVETAHLGDVLAQGGREISHGAAPMEQDLTPSLPLLDRATARALVTAHSRAA
ncbi:Hint domain-containing protein [Hasllibacter sp. MH4015]|uniref:Hint domain-containing protein n=1 Tax=Hasllibacter sp. MH4015 TaxID=2854029 RepID=UPI001CD5E518|nr:Hint domain-containing protein [Hasllibacter sp. MH4015]